MTVTLVAGPGGSGSTTVAATLARALAATSTETVLITTAASLPEEPTGADAGSHGLGR
jgi:CO dehydrogenase nickel-insertion accessory protein CooC1